MTQVPGYDIWAREIDGAWYLVDRDGNVERNGSLTLGPYRDEREALRAAERLAHTGGT